MEDYHLDLHAPQWVDFTETCSPVRMPDFFEKKHEIHERIEDLCDIASENTETGQSMSEADVPCINTKAQANLDIMKSTPIKVISPKHRNNKETVTETTYDQVFSDAMRKLELCKKPSKTREALNKTTQELNVFKTPNMTKITKSSRSFGYRSVPNKRVQSVQNSAPKSTEVNKNICILDNDTSANAKGTSVNHTLLKQDGNHTEDDTFKRSNNSVDNSKDKKEKQDEEDNKECNEENNEECKKEDTKECNEKDNKEHNEEDDKELQNESEDSTDDNKETKEEDNKDDVNATIEKANRTISNKHTVLTWYNHRRSFQKHRMSMNKKYISLAEAVSRFQNETPERFRTRSSKANVTMPFNMSKIMQNRLKPTIPISPALVSKNRTRPVTVLSREEREKLEMEEMKKYQIKANPIPRSVLRGSRVVMKTTGVSKKPIAAMNVSSMTQSSEKACTTSSLQSKSPQPHRDKASSGSKNMVTKVVVTDPLGIIVEREEIPFFGVPRNTGVTKKATRVMPFSFEARNKNLQIKKEQRLKNLQEANNTKPEFHARPVPNFSKPPTSPAKRQQKQQNLKKFSSPCPFSFDERDKKVLERKEQLVKQVFEEDKRARVFRANPAPVFKPVMVRGRSKECLLAKDNTKDSTQMASEQADKHEDQENREPNVDSSETKKENIPKTKNAIDTVDKQKAPLKAYSLKLNTDKRAKERQDFDEKIRRKEMEEEAKRQEVERKKLESDKMMKAELRKLMEVKARPMPMYKPPVIIRSQKLLTNPQSPAFASKKLRSKQT